MNKVSSLRGIGGQGRFIQGNARLALLLCSLLFLITTGFFAFTAYAASGAGKAVFGPETYERRSGPPTTYSRSFSVANHRGTFVLSIQKRVSLAA